MEFLLSRRDEKISDFVHGKNLMTLATNALWVIGVPLIGCLTLPIVALISPKFRNGWAVVLAAATALLSAVLLMVWRNRQARLGTLGFYALFALAVTASVQLVGVYLVFASLIVPALATHRIAAHRMAYAFAIGIVGYAVGLMLSAWFDLPGGATIVWAMAITGGIAMCGGRLISGSRCY